MGKHVLTAADILANCKVKEDAFEIGGGIIKVKGLTKEAQQQARKLAMSAGEIDSDQLEIEIFRAGVVEPKLTDEELISIKDQIPAALFDSIVLRISELSGVSDQLAKQVKKA